VKNYAKIYNRDEAVLLENHTSLRSQHVRAYFNAIGITQEALKRRLKYADSRT
jgi:hypothetical protein